jgi:hypothetical protein
MGERKVLNKYYPPDFDPTLIPRVRRPRDTQVTVRLMAPFNMRCTTCGLFIAKATKFNARKETVDGESYLTLRIFRFYIKCPMCSTEITFKTDPQNTDYTMEHGATRNFDFHREAAIAEREDRERRANAERDNPMQLLENRTLQSRREMDMLDALEEMQDRNAALAHLDPETILQRINQRGAPADNAAPPSSASSSTSRSVNSVEDDEELVRRAFARSADGQLVRRLPTSSVQSTRPDAAPGEGGGGDEDEDEDLSDSGSATSVAAPVGASAPAATASSAAAPEPKRPRIALAGLVRRRDDAQLSTAAPPTQPAPPPPPPPPPSAGRPGVVGGGLPLADYGSSESGDESDQDSAARGEAR